MDFITLAQERYSCRKLSGAPIEQEKIDQIIKAAQLSPTAKNLQPYRIWVMKSDEAKKAIGEVTSCIFGAELFFVVGGKKDEAWVRPYDHANFVDVDASIVATHMMLAIQDIGLATTWVANFDAPKLQQIYPEMQGYDLVAIFPVGYAQEDAAPSERHTDRKEKDAVVKEL